MQIQFRLTVCIGLLAMVAMALLGLELVRGSRQLQTSTMASAQAKGLHLALAANDSVNLERAMWNTAFSAPGALSEAVAQALAASAETVDARIAETIIASTEAGIDPEPLLEAKRIMTETRRAALPIARQPSSDRPAGTMMAVGGEVYRANNTLGQYLSQVEHAITLTEPGVSRPVQLARRASELRVTAGIRSSLLSAYIAGNVLKPDQLTQATELGGQVAELWRNQIDLIAGMGDPADLVAAREAVRSSLMTVGEDRYRTNLAAARRGEKPPEANDAWRTWTVPMLQNALILREAALRRVDDTIARSLREAWLRLGLVLGGCCMFAASLGWVIITVRTSLLRPLHRITETIGALAQGQLNVAVSATERRDEIGAVARALLVLRDNAGAARAAEQAETAAQQQRLAASAALARNAAQFEANGRKALASVSAEMTAMRHSADNLAGSAAELARDAIASTKAIANIRAEIDGMADAAEQLAGTAGDVAGRMDQATVAVRLVTNAASAGRQQVDGLKASAAQVGDITRLIRDIAARTNLLALNATIEAARAGEAGHGFAVVAGEVKNLASQTARATEDVERQVALIHQATDATAARIGEVDGAVSGLAATTDGIAQAVAEQRTAIAEIAQAVQSVAQGSLLIGAASQRVAAASDRGRHEALEVSERVNTASEAIGQLDGAVTGFLASVQAA